MNPAHKIISFAFDHSIALPAHERRDLYLAMAELLQGDESEKLRKLACTLGNQIRETEELQCQLKLGAA